MCWLVNGVHAAGGSVGATVADAEVPTESIAPTPIQNRPNAVAYFFSLLIVSFCPIG